MIESAYVMTDSNQEAAVKEDGHPIPSELIDRIDIITTSKSGDVQLIIVAAGYLDESSYTTNRIFEKVESYIQQAHSEEFAKDFCAPSSGKISIVLSCNQTPHDSVLVVCKNIQKELENFNISFFVEVNK